MTREDIEKWVPIVWIPDDWDYRSHPLPIRIEKVPQKEGPDKYTVRRGSFCVDRNGIWDIEPIPSDRTDIFLYKHRFDTFKEALRIAKSALLAGEGK